MNAHAARLVLVTGGAGFIGSHTCEALLGQGYRVRVLDDFSSGTLANLAAVRDRVEVIEGSVTSTALMARAVIGCFGVVHLAARASVTESFSDTKGYREVNVDGTANLIDVARRNGVERIVFASSCCVYGLGAAPQDETMTPQPLSPYALTKLDGEHLLRDAAAAGSIDAGVLRFFNIYGARQDPSSAYAAVIPRFLAALRRREAVTLYGDGEQTRDFTSVTDAARAITLALNAPSPLRATPINIGTGVATSINALVTVIAGVCGVSAVQRFEPAREGEVRDSVANTSRADALLGFRAETTLAAGLANMQ